MNPFIRIPGHTNLYRHEVTGKYYQLWGYGVTPNKCWIIAPSFRELKDIDIASGQFIYGVDVVQFDTGSIQAGAAFYTHHRGESNA